LTINSGKPELAAQKDVTALIRKLKKLDKSELLEHAFQMPEQILLGVEAARSFDEGDLPLDRTMIHLVGLGGSAIAGELLNDILAPRRFISLHRGTNPPRDKKGVIVSSYSGNTREIIELAHRVTGGLRTVVFLTSNGDLARLGEEWSIPVWRIPAGYQPRAAIGWSLSLALAVMERWRIVTEDAQNRLVKAARRLKASLEQDAVRKHILVRAALPIAQAIKDKNTVIFHSLQCTGAAGRFAAQISENAKLPVFMQQVPEAMHNVVQGIAGASPDQWMLIFMSDANGDAPMLREAMNKTQQFFSELGFACLSFPAAGDDQFEMTLSRLLIADLVSLFLAGLKGIDPAPIKVIEDLKETGKIDAKPVKEPKEFSE